LSKQQKIVGDTPQTTTSTNPFLIFLAQRPEPKQIDVSTKKLEKNNFKDWKSIHAAGGYDHNNFRLKNWQEIISQIQLNN
jgi:hypothetical protein